MRYFNNTKYSTTINDAGGISAGDTTVTLTAVTGFPSVPFYLEMEDEMALVTDVTGLVATIVRGFDGTTAAAHADGTTVSFKSSSEAFRAAMSGHHRPLVIGGGGGSMPSGWPTGSDFLWQAFCGERWTVAPAQVNSWPANRAWLKLVRIPHNIKITDLRIRSGTTVSPRTVDIGFYSVGADGMPDTLQHEFNWALSGVSGNEDLTALSAQVLGGFYWRVMAVDGGTNVHLFGNNSALSPYATYYGNVTSMYHGWRMDDAGYVGGAGGLPATWPGSFTTPVQENRSLWLMGQFDHYGS